MLAPPRCHDAIAWVTLIAIAFAARASADDCVHTCPSVEYDARGCCPAKAKPPPRPAPNPKPTTTPHPKPVAPDKPDPTCPVGMVHVPAATFVMGSVEGDGKASEHPAHHVTLSGYCIDKTEVTVAAYAKCVSNGHCPPAPQTISGHGTDDEITKKLNSLCNGARSDKQNHPVNCVDWDQSEKYCEWVSRRLPTEAEWEYAARGSDARKYPWGNDEPSVNKLNACGGECVARWKQLGIPRPGMYVEQDGDAETAPVGSYKNDASPFGALDMGGNVSEWTGDWYGPYTGDAQTNPTGATSGTHRVFRGGAWDSFDAELVRSALRYLGEPSFRAAILGFRCARGD